MVSRQKHSIKETHGGVGGRERGRERVKGRKNDRRFIDPPKPRAYNFFF